MLASLFPGLPRFYLPFVLTIIHRSGRLAKNGEALRAFITWMTSGGREGGHRGGGAQLPKVDVRWTEGGKGPNCQNSTLDHLFKCSTTVYGLQTLAWLKLLVLKSKKLTFKFSTYIFEYWLLPTYIHLVSTRVMKVRKSLSSLVHTYLNIGLSPLSSTSCPLMWWMLPGLPHFSLLSTPTYYYDCRR